MAPIILNEKQKQFLFENGYVDAKSLDAAIEPGWKKYFLENFIWILDADQTAYRTRPLVLVDADFPTYPAYSIEIIFHKYDFEKIQNLT